MMFSAVAIQMQVAVDVDITDVIDAIPMRLLPVPEAQPSLVPTKRNVGVDELPEEQKGYVD
jgi:hypothetical protein